MDRNNNNKDLSTLWPPLESLDHRTVVFANETCHWVELLAVQSVTERQETREWVRMPPFSKHEWNFLGKSTDDI